MKSFAKRLAAPIAARLLRRWTNVAIPGPVGPGAAPARSAQSPPRSLGRSAFLIHTPELLNHFGNVMAQLPAGSFDLAVCGEAEGSPEVTVAASRFKARIVSVRDVLASGWRYDFVVSNHPAMMGSAAEFAQLASIHVRFMYAVGKSGWNLSGWNDLYDVILCFGPYHAYELARRTRATIVQMGYPRFDSYFTEAADREGLQRRFGCDPARRTVVWLPTWSSLSSMDLFGRQVSALTAHYNVVVKLHPLCLGSEPARVEAMRRHPFTRLITDATDNLPLYQLADYMLFDYGGPPFAGVYTDKKMLLLDVPGAQNDPLTGADSPDITLREHIAHVAAEGGDLMAMLNDDRIWDAQREQRRLLRRQYFAPYYGFSANVATLALRNLRHVVGAPVAD